VIGEIIWVRVFIYQQSPRA